MNRELPDVQAGFRKGRGTRDQIANICWITEIARAFQRNIYFCFIDYTNAIDFVDHNKLWKILKKMRIPDHLTSLLKNLYAGQETIRTRYGTMDWFKLGKEVHQGCILSHCLFNLYAEYLMWNARLDEAQAGIKIAGRNINNLRYADGTTLMAESKEELKSFLMKVKECKKVNLRLNIQKTKIMASGPITSWQIDGEKMQTVTDCIVLGSKNTVDGNCSHDIKKILAPWRKSYDRPRQHIKKQRPFFDNKGLSSQMVMYGYESWMWEGWALNNWYFWTVVLEKTLESPLDYKEIKLVNPKGIQSWIYIGRTAAQAEAPILWPPDAKSWLIRKDPDAGKDWRQKEKGMTEDEMVGWQHWLKGREFEQALGGGEGQGSLACCSPWGRRVRHDWATEQQQIPVIKAKRVCRSHYTTHSEAIIEPYRLLLLYFLKTYFWILPINNVVIVSGRPRRDSAIPIPIHVSVLPQTPLPSRLTYNTECSSLGYTVGPRWLSTELLLL